MRTQRNTWKSWQGDELWQRSFRVPAHPQENDVLFIVPVVKVISIDSRMEWALFLNWRKSVLTPQDSLNVSLAPAQTPGVLILATSAFTSTPWPGPFASNGGIGGTKHTLALDSFPSAPEIHSREHDAKIANVKVTFPSGNTWCVKKSTADGDGNVHINTGNVERGCFPPLDLSCHIVLSWAKLFRSGIYSHKALTKGIQRNSPRFTPTGRLSNIWSETCCQFR